MKNTATTGEPQYQHCLEVLKTSGLTQLGLMTNQAWHDDPKHLLFTLSRYKFVSKMFAGCGHVVEVGCADAWATRLVVQNVKRLTATDFDPVFIEDVQRRMDPEWPFEARQHDMLAAPLPFLADAVYAMDVIEHIPAADEQHFVQNMVASLKPEGMLLLGCPSLQSQAYASRLSREGHVNCKTGTTMRELLSVFFHNVLIFSMNDEVVHTGYEAMAHYVIGIGATRRQS